MSSDSCLVKDITTHHFETLAVKLVVPYVYGVEINRPDHKNALNLAFWREIGQCFRALHRDDTCRVIILSGAGSVFSMGMDPADGKRLVEISQGSDDVARKSRKIYDMLRADQSSLSAIEDCPKPVIACAHSACLWAGLHLIAGADIRYCTADAYFNIPGAKIGLVSDLGILQRMSKIIGSESLVRELAFTGREMLSTEAEKCGLVGRVFPDKESMMATVILLAESIANKSPVAVQGTKVQLNYARDHSVAEGLEYQATWSMMLLQSDDLPNSTKGKFADY